MKKIYTLLFFLFTILSLDAQNCPETTDISNTGGSQLAFCNPAGIMQTFTPTRNGYLTKVRIYYQNSANNIVFTVYNGSGNSGTNLYSSTFNLYSGSYFDFVIPYGKVTAQIGTGLTFEVKDNSSYLDMFYCSCNNYQQGSSNINNTYIGSSGNDLNFQTYVTQSQMTASITNSSPVTSCSNNLTQLTGTNVTGTAYQWYNSGGIINGATTVNYTPAVSESYYYMVTDNTIGCTQTSNTVTVNEHTSPIVTQSAFNPACSSVSPYTLTGGSPSNGTYSGTNVSSPYYMTSYSGPGTFTVNYTYTDGYGCSSIATQSLTVLAPAATPGAITGNAAVCEGTSITYSVAPVTNATWYKWTLPTGATISSGAGTNSILVAFSGTASSGNVAVADSNVGCPLSSISSEAITVNYPAVVTVNPTNKTICGSSSTSVNFPITATGAGLTYQWQVNSGAGFVNVTPSANYASPTSNPLTVVNPPNSFNGYQYQCIVTGTCGVPATSGSATLTVNAKPVINSIAASSNHICQNSGASISVNAVGTGLTYQWQFNSGASWNNVSNNASYTGATTSLLGLTNSTGSQQGSYRCIIAGTCPPSDTTVAVPVTVTIPPAPYICLVTADSLSLNNIIHWDKTQYPSADSFLVYRYDVVSSGYLRVGAVGKDSSHLTDVARNIGGPNGGDPTISSWQYKLAVKDTCGHLSALSPYHQTVFVQESNQNFSWNAYTIESGQSNPVSGYSFLRDSINNGHWKVIANTAGLSATDNQYASYPNGNWRVDALGFNCTAVQRPIGGNSTLATINTSKSNIKRPPIIISGFAANTLFTDLKLYPNPATREVTLEFPAGIHHGNVKLIGLTGQVFFDREILNTSNSDMTQTIPTGHLARGIYFVCVESQDKRIYKKLVLE